VSDMHNARLYVRQEAKDMPNARQALSVPTPWHSLCSCEVSRRSYF